MGLKWKKYFDGHPSDLIKDTRVVDTKITRDDGSIVFQQDGVRVPSAWSDRAATIVASQYFRGNVGEGNREKSYTEVINRVVGRITGWALETGYFKNEESLLNFRDDLFYILWNQMASFNSPVWYNLGLEGEIQQGSACFIVDVEDNMPSITERLSIESNIFRWGSGSGANNSKLRASTEPLSKGGRSSGPVSFMLIYDAAAEVIKSAGKRRAAKMEILDVDHPDIMEFITCKGDQEAIGELIKKVGGETAINQTQVRHQNANHSVALSDEFMLAVRNRLEWNLIGRLDKEDVAGVSGNIHGHRMIDGKRGQVVAKKKANDIFHLVAEQAWKCGDPGVFFPDNINRWNTVPSWGKIVSSNPCAEFVQPPWSACNLASLNLVKFLDEKGSFRFQEYCAAVRTLITAMDIIAANADYPDERIGENSRHYRPLGLGYSNLGAALIRLGLPYDSQKARNFAAAVTSLMSAEAWLQSANIEAASGHAEPRFPKEDVVNVLRKHLDACPTSEYYVMKGLDWGEIKSIWENAILVADLSGVSNSQVTLLAPTGTISFMMDCETTGIEPLVMLGGKKKMADTGEMKFELPECVKFHLHRIGSDVPHPDDQVLHTAFGGMGCKTIKYMGHLEMMIAVQPFLSGAISKTVNVPNEISVNEIKDLYDYAWEQGLKSVAIYRDGSKFEQVYEMDEQQKDEAPKPAKTNGLRMRLPDTRKSLTHKFGIGDHKGYINVGFYPDGRPGEIFINMAKQGSTVRGLLDWGAILVSMCLQYGVPLEDLVEKFKGVKFEPQGITGNHDVMFAQSPVDYIFRWLESEFILQEKQAPADEEQGYDVQEKTDASGPPCGACGSIMLLRGTCFYCENCDTTTGCS